MIKKVIENKRDYSKFFTPAPIAYSMAKLLDAKNGEFIIEPSAGNGALCKAVQRYSGYGVIIDAVEPNKDHYESLSDICRAVFIGDFLQAPIEKNFFDGCIANPPFGNGVDIQAHFDKIHHIVKHKGKIVAIVPYDFNPSKVFNYTYHPIKNWSKNSDGTTTEIKIIEFINP